MEVQEITSQLEALSKKKAQEIKGEMSSDIIQNPDQMIKEQFNIMQYSLFVKYESAIIGTLKEMLNGIIQKI